MVRGRGRARGREEGMEVGLTGKMIVDIQPPVNSEGDNQGRQITSKTPTHCHVTSYSMFEEDGEKMKLKDLETETRKAQILATDEAHKATTTDYSGLKTVSITAWGSQAEGKP